MQRSGSDTLAHWRSTTGYGRGIAAPQLGVSLRVIFLKLPGVEPWPLINPEIIACSEEKIVVWDACLSFLSIFMQVERHRQVTRPLSKSRWRDAANSKPEMTAVFPNFCNTKSTTSTAYLRIDRVLDVKTICTREEFEKRYRDASPYAVAPATIKARS